MGEDTGEAINKLTTSLYENYYAQEHVLRDVSDFAFDGVDMLGIHFHKIDLVRGSSYIESPEWLKNKGATINPHNTKDNYCFMYAVTIALCHEEIGWNPKRISNKLISCIPKYNWDNIDFLAGRKDWQTFERNNKDIALNILSVPYNKEKIVVQYQSKYNRKRKYQIVLLMVTDNKGTWLYLPLKSFSKIKDHVDPHKSISRLFYKKTSSNTGRDYNCLSCLKSFQTGMS